MIFAFIAITPLGAVFTGKRDISIEMRSDLEYVLNAIRWLKHGMPSAAYSRLRDAILQKLQVNPEPKIILVDSTI
jgi:hypothetical protein